MANPINNLQDQEYNTRIWDGAVKAGTTVQDILKPEFWVHVAHLLRPMQEIRIVSEDLKWYARLLVGNVVTGQISGQIPQASVLLLQYVDFSKSKTVQPKSSDYAIEWKSPEAKHCIINKSTGEILQSGFADEVAAGKALDKLVGSLGGKAAA